MEELFKLLAEFQACLESQIRVFKSLIPWLDAEEAAIEHFDMSDFERIVIEKDHVVRRLQAVEKRRIALLYKISVLIGYDHRGDTTSLRSFLLAFSTYVNNVAGLVGAEVAAELQNSLAMAKNVERDYRAFFAEAAPRIYRNRQILQKASLNFSRSFAVLASAAGNEENYDPSGRSRSRFGRNEPLSFLKVKA